MTYRPGENVHWIQADKAVVGPNSFATGVGRPRHVEILGTPNVCPFNLSKEPVPAPETTEVTAP